MKKSLRRGEPVISVDTKKKERVGNFKNGGKTWRRKGQPLAVNVYDYPHLGQGTAIPYGAYDVQRNEGFVNVGMTHDTAEFAVQSLRQWWKLVGADITRAPRRCSCALTAVVVTVATTVPGNTICNTLATNMV